MTFKIYFSGSIAGGMQDAEHYREIIKELGVYGQVLTEHLWDDELHVSLEKGVYPAGWEHLATEEGTYSQDVAWVSEADVVIAEVSTPSLGVGYEIAYAERLGTPVLCLYRKGSPKRLSSMVAGNSYFRVIEYHDMRNLALALFDYLKPSAQLERMKAKILG